ncbi:hypothetical protein [Emticicia sp. C21]|uniref:hypothetical protein n=1 Tax=Emticicia sp. C21 TaxID=2302915 RepID=UPI001313E6DF|nr:hypothetical protein [Emticicia sp. C21]
MTVDGNKIHAENRGIFKRAIGYAYHQVVLEFGKVITPQTEQKKVTNMVGTF